MCEICGMATGHNRHCPNYIPRQAVHYCSSCEGGIYGGEEYVKNTDGECRHYDCFHGMRELLEWLGYEIKTIEDTYE